MSISALRRLLPSIHARNIHVASPNPPKPAPLNKQPRVPALDYASIPLRELRKELHHRELHTKGTKVVCILRLELDDKNFNKEPSICVSPRIIRCKITMKARNRLRIAAAMLEKNTNLPASESVNLLQKAYYRAHLSYPPLALPPTAPVRSAFAPRASAFRVRRVPTTRGYATIAESTPPIIPKPWELIQEDASKPAIRVPFLPDNEFAKYHRQEFVPVIAPPHRPAVSTVDEDMSSIAAISSLSHTVEGVEGVFGDGGVLDEVLVGMEGESEGKRESILAPMDDDMGPELTEEKKTAMKLFAASAAAWWVFGEGVMRVLGIV